MTDFISALMEMSVYASFLIIGVIVARLVLRKAPKYIRKVLWALVGIRLVFPFSFESAFSVLPATNEMGETTNSAQITEQVYEGVANNTSFLSVAFYVWAAVFVALFMYGFISWLKLRLKLRDSVKLRENIYQSEKISSPFVLGIIKPKIYVGYNINEKDLNSVILHERQHITYGDHVFKVVGFLILILHWFNPLVWIAYILFCKDVELVCDEGAVKKLDVVGRKEYALALLNFGVNKVKISACPVAFGETGIKERVKSVVAYKKASKFIVAASFVVCLCLAVTLMTKPVQKEIKKPESDSVVEEVTTEPVTEAVKETESKIETKPSTTEEKSNKKESVNKKNESKNKLNDDVIAEMKKEQEKMIKEMAQRTEDEMFYAAHGYYPPKETKSKVTTTQMETRGLAELEVIDDGQSLRLAD